MVYPRKKAIFINSVNAEVRNIVDLMFEIIYEHGAVGLSANIICGGCTAKNCNRAIEYLDYENVNHKF